MKKTVFISFFILLNSFINAQSYRHVGESYFQIVLPNGYKVNNSSYENLSDGFNWIAATMTKGSGNKEGIIDTTFFQGYESGAYQMKIVGYKTIKIDGYDATYFETKNEQNERFQYLYLIHDGYVHVLRGIVLKSNKLYEEQKKSFLSAKFDPDKKPNSIADFEFSFDQSILNKLEDGLIEEESRFLHYPNISYFLSDTVNLLTQRLKIEQIYKVFNDAEKKTMIGKLTNGLFSDVEEISTDISIAGLKGKEFYYIGKNSNENEALIYVVLLFDPLKKYYVSIKFETEIDGANKLITIQEFVKSFKRKK